MTIVFILGALMMVILFSCYCNLYVDDMLIVVNHLHDVNEP
jgi:hypothetical protein